MKKKVIAVALGVGLMGSMAANAEDAKAVTGLVFGLQVGYASGFDAPSGQSVTIPTGGGTSVNGSHSITNGNVNFGGLVGYDFAITEMFSLGVEVDINYTPDMVKNSISGGGSIPGGSFNISADNNTSSLNIPLMLTGKMVLPSGMNLFVKGGIDYQRISSSNSCSASIDFITVPCDLSSDESTYSNWNGVLAAGVGYQIQSFNVFAQYMYVFGQKISNYETNKTLAQGIITGGVSYSLPM